MNLLDINFQNFLKEIHDKKEEEILLHMKEKYLSLNEATRESIEDFLEKYPYWGKLSFKEEQFEEIEIKAKILKEEEKQFLEFYNSLGDYRSKKVLYAILKNWYDYNFEDLNLVMDNTFKHYFDLDLIPSSESEVFVDLGAYNGDTIYDYWNSYGMHEEQKIYAYEMTPEIIESLKANTKDYPNVLIREYAVSNYEGTSSCLENPFSSSANVLNKEEGSVKVTTLDADIKEKITMLKMDIEGSEYNALLGGEQHIKKDKPKLMISVYHGHADLLRIWKLLKSWNPEYHFYLRYYGGPIFPTEIVLYALSF